jgi:hypothetical protein
VELTLTPWSPIVSRSCGFAWQELGALQTNACRPMVVVPLDPPLRSPVEAAIRRFGPPGDVPSHVVDEVERLLALELPSHSASRAEQRIDDLIVAYGCGVWRARQSGVGPWADLWQPAFNELAGYVHGWMKATWKWFTYQIVLEGFAFVVPRPTRDAAQLLTWQIIDGGCDCWRRRATNESAPDPVDANASRQLQRCLRAHRLSGWRPATSSLQHFVATATKGAMRKGEGGAGRVGFSAGAVKQGMFYNVLHREHHARFGDVLMRRCPDHSDSGYEASACPLCQVPFSERAHRRFVTARFVVPVDFGGRYEQCPFWHCQHCGNYYPQELEACPLESCGGRRTRGVARSQVWVRAERMLTGSVSGALPNQARVVALDEAMTRLPGLQAKIVSSTRQGLEPDEIASHLKLPLDLVEKELAQATEMLRRILTGGPAQ